MRGRIDFFRICGFAAVLASGVAAAAQTADQAWLNFRGTGNRWIVPLRVHALGNGPLETSAARELLRGIEDLSHASVLWRGSAFEGRTIVGTVDEVRHAFPILPVPSDLQPEGYWLFWFGSLGDLKGSEDKARLIVAGADDRGVLYGAFALLRQISTGPGLYGINTASSLALVWSS